MHPRQSISDELRSLAQDQAGVLTTHQLLAGGLSRSVIHRLASAWEHPIRGVYLTGALTWRAAVWTGLLHGGPTAAVGEEAAAYLHGAVRDEPTLVAVWAPIKRSGFVVGGWEVVFRRGLRRSMGTPPRTPLDVALVDLASHSSEDAVVAAISRALAQRRTTPERLLTVVESRERVRHSAVLKDLCSHAGEGIESALEWRFSQVIARHGLPVAERQVAAGATRIDALFRVERLVVELDGARDHTNWSKDMMRDNSRIIESSMITLRYGWNAVTGEPCLVAAQVAAALRSQGWEGTLRSCHRCQTD